jgi:hypothetical protein
MLAPRWRAYDLQSAALEELPTRRRVTWYRTWAVIRAAFAGAFVVFALAGTPLLGVLAALLAVSAWSDWVQGRTFAALLESPPTASLHPDDETIVDQAVAVGFSGAVSVLSSGRSGVLDAGLEIGNEVSIRLWRRRKPRWIARSRVVTSGDLLTGEDRLVSCRALLTPHGPRRVVLYASFGAATPWMVRDCVLTVTDRRLLFHRRPRFWQRRRPHRLEVTVDLPHVEVLEWFRGHYVERRSHVLLIRVPEHGVLRVNIDRIWAEEAQLAFNALASCSARPPAFLAARWSAPLGD